MPNVDLAIMSRTHNDTRRNVLMFQTEFPNFEIRMEKMSD